MKNFIISIGRQLGSGGKEIAEKLGERLNINVYD
ncbi:MAG: cytidylate kinase family protein, partial [Bacteroidaceae bacterium]|nr:cytidylate kinase family protein [Bacteroidaceae bacterium]